MGRYDIDFTGTWDILRISRTEWTQHNEIARYTFGDSPWDEYVLNIYVDSVTREILSVDCPRGADVREESWRGGLGIWGPESHGVPGEMDRALFLERGDDPDSLDGYSVRYYEDVMLINLAFGSAEETAFRYRDDRLFMYYDKGFRLQAIAILDLTTEELEVIREKGKAQKKSSLSPDTRDNTVHYPPLPDIEPPTMPTEGLDIKGDVVFGCDGDPSVLRVPEGIRQIGYCAFSSKKNLQAVFLPASVALIHNDAFWSCESLREVHLSSSVRFIGHAAFEYCNRLKYIYVDGRRELVWGFDSDTLQDRTEDVVSLIAGATMLEPEWVYWVYYSGDIEGFGGNVDEMPSDLVIPAGVTRVTTCAFRGWTMKSVRVPDTVRVIGSHAFAGCERLTRVELPSTPIAVGESAFLGCVNLTEVRIGDARYALPKGVSSDNPLNAIAKRLLPHVTIV